MIGEDNMFVVRKIVFELLIQFLKEFVLRLIVLCWDLQYRIFENFNMLLVDLKKVVMNFVIWIEGMIRWENSNYLIVVFYSQDIQIVFVVYRCFKNVFQNIEEMFESQI